MPNQMHERLYRASSQIEFVQSSLSQLQIQKLDLEKQYEASQERIDFMGQGAEALKRIMSEMADKGIRSLEKLIQDALNIVFNDRAYEISISVEDKRGVKSLYFILKEVVDGVLVESDIRDSVGGSVVTIVSLVCQIFYIQWMEAKKVIFIDEAFADIAKEYLENLFTLLKVFKEKLGFNFLVITHNAEVLPYCSRIYEVSNGEVRELKKNA